MGRHAITVVFAASPNLEERALQRGVAAIHRRLAYAGQPAESGTVLAEYAPILGVIAVLVAAVLTPLGGAVGGLLAPVLQAF